MSFLQLNSWPSLSWLQALPASFRVLGWVDILDILVVAMLLYVAYLWLRYTRASRVAQGMLILGVIYFIASQVGMVLTTIIFRAFFTVLLVALVIIFQEDLKRFFERLAIWRWRSAGAPMRREVIEPLIRSIYLFAQERIGALIVIRGTDPLDRHIQGGHALRGELCSPLLESLFDPHSDGHDGAVLIEGNRLTHFGVHLPLSRNADQLSGHGTRHAAALGLSEVSDAFCLVVSEEKGTISVARNGQLLTIPNRKILEQRIKAYLETKSETPAARGLLTRFAHNLGPKLGCLSAAFVLWLIFVQGFKPVEQTVNVLVRYEDVPEGLRVRTVAPRTVAVTVGGLKRDFNNLPPLHATIDLEEAHVGTMRAAVLQESIMLPRALRVVRIEPAEVELQLAAIKPALTVIPNPAPENIGKSRHRWFGLR